MTRLPGAAGALAAASSLTGSTIARGARRGAACGLGSSPGSWRVRSPWFSPAPRSCSRWPSRSCTCDLGITDITGFPRSIDGVAGIILLNEKWPQGTDLRLDVVVTHPDRAEVRAAIEQLKVDALKITGLSGPPVERLSTKGDAAMISFTMGGGRNDEANWSIVHRVREELRPQLFSDLSDVRMLVSGQAAVAHDVVQVYVDGTPRIFVFVLGLSFLLMLVAFHSIVIPIKAILLNLLSTRRRATGCWSSSSATAGWLSHSGSRPAG